MISSLTPLTTAVPLFLVLALTAIKDAYDDFVSDSFIVGIVLVHTSSEGH